MASLKATINHHYKVTCVRRDGSVVWEDEFDNLITTAGLDAYLDAFFNGLESPSPCLGIKGTGSVVAGDTLSSHAGWVEIQDYDNATRPTFTPGTVADGSLNNSAAMAIFYMNAATTVYGFFMCDQPVKASNVGTLVGGGDFDSPRAVEDGQALNVIVTCSITAG